jgi:asparagine synthase (glutamine-hydrolysing)
VSFPGSAKYDESLVAKQVAKHIGVKLIEVPITELKFSTFEKIIDKLDEPFVDTSILPTYLVAEAVGLDHKIAITGDGADEVFGGYKHYQRALRLQKLSNLPMFSTHFFELLSMIFHHQNKTRYARWSENCRSIIKGVPFYNMHLIDKPLFEKLFSNESYDQVRQQSLIDIESANPQNYVNKLMQFDFKNYMVGDVLTKVDRASMMNAVEFRTPFLNQEVVCFANSLPIGDKVDVISRKKIVKELASKYLPSDYNFQRKAGFSIPIEGWLNTQNISERVFGYLRQNNSIFTVAQLDEIFRIQKQRGGLAEFIIGIWMFEKWRNRLGVK